MGEQANSLGKKIIIPVDAVCSDHFPKGPMKKEETVTFDLTPGNSDAGIKDGWMGLDAGPKTLALIKESLVGTTKLVQDNTGQTRPYHVCPNALHSIADCAAYPLLSPNNKNT